MPHFDHPDCDHPALPAFASVAREYCDVVEQHAAIEGEALLVAVHRLLPLLYASALALPSTDVLFDLTGTDEDEERPDAPPLIQSDPDRLPGERSAALRRQLAAAIGPARYYREVFDPYDPPERGEVTADLADDIAGIHADLLEGLAKWSRGESGKALWAWRFGFETHWGEHASGALRALWARSAWHDRPWPAGTHHAT